MDEIVTRRLRWRPPAPVDIAGLLALWSDWEVARMTAGLAWPPDPAAVAARCRADPATDGLLGHVFLGETFIGTCSLRATDTGPMLGYLLARAHWGRGYAAEIAGAVIAAGWARHPWPWIRATVFEDNPASMRVLGKLGFAEVERGTGPSRARGPDDQPLRHFRLHRPPGPRAHP